MRNPYTYFLDLCNCVRLVCMAIWLDGWHLECIDARCKCNTRDRMKNGNQLESKHSNKRKACFMLHANKFMFYYSLSTPLILVFTETLCCERDFLSHNSSICTEIFIFSLSTIIYTLVPRHFFFGLCYFHLSFDQLHAKRVVFTLQNENSLLLWNAIYFVIQIQIQFKSSGRTIRQIQF